MNHVFSKLVVLVPTGSRQPLDQGKTSRYLYCLCMCKHILFVNPDNSNPDGIVLHMYSQWEMIPRFQFVYSIPDSRFQKWIDSSKSGSGTFGISHQQCIHAQYQVHSQTSMQEGQSLHASDPTQSDAHCS